MLNRLLLFTFCALLGSCAINSPTAVPADNFREASTAIGLYAQARIAWSEGNVERAILLCREAHAADPESPYPMFLEADILIKIGRVQEALALLEKITKIAPDFRDAHLLAGTILVSIGKESEATPYLRKAVQLDPGEKEAAIQLSTILIKQFEYEEAVNTLKNLVKNSDEPAIGNYYLGKAYAQMRLFKDATQYYKLALQQQPDMAQAAIDLAITYEAMGETDLAISTYRDLLEVAENRTPLLNRLVQLAISGRRYKEALDYLERLNAMGVGIPENNRKIGLIYLELERYDEAIALFKDMLAQDPDDYLLHIYLGSAYEDKNMLQQAKDQFEQVPEHSPAYPEAVVRIAALLHEQGKTAQAKELLQKTIAEKGAAIELHLYLAALYDSTDNSKKAMEYLRSIEGNFPNEPRLHFRMGVLLDKLHDRQGSIAQMKKVIELNPEDAQALNYLGYTYAEMAIHLDEALSYINRALALRPDDGFFIDSLGWVYYQMKKYDKAIKHLKKAAQLVPDDPVITEHLADAYAAHKDAKNALKYYKKAKELAPDKEKEISIKIQQLLRTESAIP